MSELIVEDLCGWGERHSEEMLKESLNSVLRRIRTGRGGSYEADDTKPMIDGQNQGSAESFRTHQITKLVNGIDNLFYDSFLYNREILIFLSVVFEDMPEGLSGFLTDNIFNGSEGLQTEVVFRQSQEGANVQIRLGNGRVNYLIDRKSSSVEFVMQKKPERDWIDQEVDIPQYSETEILLDLMNLFSQSKNNC